MPTYTFKEKDTGEQFDKLMKISEKAGFLERNPNLESVLTAPAFVGDHIIKKMDGGMKETIQRIAEQHPGSALADRFGDNKSIAQKKTVDVAKKHGILTNKYK